MCPCGQVHDVGSSDCPLAAAASDGIKVEPEVSSVDGQPEPTKMKDEEELPVLTEALPAPEELLIVNLTADVESSAAADDRPADVAADAADPTDSVAQLVEVAQPWDESEGGAASSSSVPELDLDELAAQGLDGASLWMRRFEAQLKTLCRPDQLGVAQTALETMLRLVRNVVQSPSEQKFRRIRSDNPKVRSSLLSAGNAVEALLTSLGFEAVSEGGVRIFLLRDATFDTVRLRMGQELLERELSRSTMPAVR